MPPFFCPSLIASLVSRWLLTDEAGRKAARGPVVGATFVVMEARNRFSSPALASTMSPVVALLQTKRCLVALGGLCQDTVSSVSHREELLVYFTHKVVELWTGLLSQWWVIMPKGDKVLCCILACVQEEHRELWDMTYDLDSCPTNKISQCDTGPLLGQ